MIAYLAATITGLRPSVLLNEWPEDEVAGILAIHYQGRK